MYELFGAAVVGNSVEFRLFFPDSAVDSTQYTRGAAPNIKTIRVTGDFQEDVGTTNWDPGSGPVMVKQPHPKGWLYTCQIPHLPDGYYQYKYFVTFNNQTTRWCADPCTKYGGAENENSAFVIGGTPFGSTAVDPIPNPLPLQDLIIYEVMLDDFTAGDRGTRAPMDAMIDRIPYLKDLGINAVEFMPWTAWPGDNFSWGYDPFSFFAVEHRYTHDPATPLDKLAKFAALVNELHRNEIHVIMDGVFNHFVAGKDPNRGFGYYWLYENPAECPYYGNYQSGGFFEEFDFNNTCTEEFIFDVCKYWLTRFEVDGIRFDFVKGFYHRDNQEQGIARVIRDVKDFAAETDKSVALMLELLTDNRFEAIDDTNRIGASGCWFDPLMWEAFNIAEGRSISPYWMRCLHAAQDFADGKVPVTYIENHDHSTLANHAGARAWWWKTQPLAMALLTCSGAVLIHNGQEFGDDYWFPEDGHGRVLPRPVQWNKSTDFVGDRLRDLYRNLIRIRKEHPALRSPNFYPANYDGSWTRFNGEGYGVAVDQGLVIYHRWGNRDDGQLERFIVVLNFSDYDQFISLPFSVNGKWEDLLNGGSVKINDYWLSNQRISSNWGRIYYHS
jgi:pullulanase